MTREEAKELLPVIKAYAEGKTIQMVDDENEWIDLNEPTFDGEPSSYRIKPEPKYRPFRTQEECWKEMHKHNDFGWVMSKDKKELVQIGLLSKTRDGGCLITLIIDEGRNIASTYYFKNYTFTDGVPFGIKEE